MRRKMSLRDGNNKKLTDFFVARPSTSASASSSTERTTRMSTASGRKPATATSMTTVDHESSIGRSASTVRTRKRARSPESNNSNTSLVPPSKLKSPRKPIEISQSDSNYRSPKPYVYIPSPVSRKVAAQKSSPMQGRKKKSVVSPSDSSKQVVYSSQSDEEELVLPNPECPDLGKAIEGVYMQRRNTSDSSLFSSSYGPEDAMEVDMLPSSSIRGSPNACNASLCSWPPVHSIKTSKSYASSQTPVVAFSSLPSSPDTNEPPPLPPTPQPIDAETKTAQLIAEIKARAFATQQSSDDEQLLSFHELEDSDDDDLFGDLPLTGGIRENSSLLSAPGDIFSSPLSSVPSNFDEGTAGLRRTMDFSPSPRPTRTSTRTRKPALASRLPLAVASSSASIGTTTKSVPVVSKRKSRATNPLQALLREKELEDKRGTSAVALRLAEEATMQCSREERVGSDGDELETLNRLRLADEQAAWKAVRESHESNSPVESMEDFTAGENGSKTLGISSGEAIHRILAGDRASKGKERDRSTSQEVTVTISLWTQPLDEEMEVDIAPILPLSGHPVLTRLDCIRRDGDDSLLDLALRAGTLAAVPGDVLSSNMPQLVGMALFASAQVSDAVCIALRDMWVVEPRKVQMPFAAILSGLVQLGANPSVFEDLGFFTEHVPKNHITHGIRFESLKRLLAIMKATGFAGAFCPDDVANVVLSLAIMGLDLLTSGELRIQLNVTLDVICNYSTSAHLLHDIHEKVLNFSGKLTSAEKARLVSFFASGSGRTKCIARCLAYCLLVSATTFPTDQVPPLEPLILLLSPDAGSYGLFDVSNESMDYEELGNHVNILSVALIDVAPYVEQERNTLESANSSSVRGNPNKPKRGEAPPLELLRKVLESLQNKIVDTRAAHLDRSRTKAAIQRLTMRIYYDRMALLGVRSRPRTSTLKAYFSPQRR